MLRAASNPIRSESELEVYGVTMPLSHIMLSRVGRKEKGFSMQGADALVVELVIGRGGRGGRGWGWLTGRGWSERLR